MSTGKRAVRVGDQILREIALLFLEKVKDPRVQGVTMTGIRLSNDLKMATVFYSVLGEKNQVERVQAGLDSAKGCIKKEIGLRMALRYVPEIRFMHDTSLENGSHLEKVFEEIRKSEAEKQKEGLGKGTQVPREGELGLKEEDSSAL
jgi:ribosome-binding factor A